MLYDLMLLIPLDSVPNKVDLTNAKAKDDCKTRSHWTITWLQTLDGIGGFPRKSTHKYYLRSCLL